MMTVCEIASVKYPNIQVRLIGEDGNAFAIVARVCNALRQAKVPEQDVKDFQNTAFESESYDNLLQFVMKTVEVK